MDGNDELKEIDIKNRTCYYSYDIMQVGDFDFDNILLDEKSFEDSYENILTYVISYKTFIGAKPLRIRFDKIDGFIKIYDGTRYLVLFGPERYDIYDRIRYLIREKSGIKCSIGHNFARRRIDSYNSLSIGKTLTFQNAIILIKAVDNKNKNNYYYSIFLEKRSYEDKSNRHFLNECLNIINPIF